MRLPLFTLFLVLGTISVCGQKFSFSEKTIDQEKCDMSLPELQVVDYTLKERNTGAEIFLNNNGLYQYADSSLISAILYMYLTTVDDTSSIYGLLTGKIINGKKEGKWIKKIFVTKYKEVVVQEMEFNNGLLDGDYYAYDINGEILRRFYPNGKEFPGLMYNIDGKNVYVREFMKLAKNRKDIPTSSFNHGTGNYVDYYYDSGAIKEKGSFKDGIKDGQWYVYDKQGEFLRIDTYHNGVSVTD